MSSSEQVKPGKALSSVPQRGYMVTGPYNFRDLDPWVKRVLRSYTDRMRVNNFSPVGNVVFSEILQKALTGRAVFFSMVPNGRESKTWTTETAIDQSSTDSEPNAPVETISDNNSGQQTVNNGQSTITKIIQSGKDPIDQDNIPEGSRSDFPDCSTVDTIDYAGLCYDSDDQVIPNLYCLLLEDPVIDDKVMKYAQAASEYDDSIISSLPDIVRPRKIAEGLPNNTQVRSRKPEDTAEDDPDNPWTLLPSAGVKGGAQVIVPNAKFLGPQWNTQLMAGFMSSLMMEFLGAVNVPPVDFPEIGTLSQQTQSLVSNREPFVSRMKRIRAEVDAVFYSAGVPELSWELPFPYTPQDIASIGDANGKGVNSETLRSMNLG